MTWLKAGDLVDSISEEHNLAPTLTLFGKHAEPLRRVLIIWWGPHRSSPGRHAGNRVAVKIIEKNRQRCDWLAERMNKAVVLHGDGSDQNLLIEENIQDMVRRCHPDQRRGNHILASLLTCCSPQAPQMHHQTEQIQLFPLVAAIGIDQVVKLPSVRHQQHSAAHPQGQGPVCRFPEGRGSGGHGSRGPGRHPISSASPCTERSPFPMAPGGEHHPGNEAIILSGLASSHRYAGGSCSSSCGVLPAIEMLTVKLEFLNALALYSPDCVGLLLLFVGISMVFSLLAGLCCQDDSRRPLLLAMGVTVGDTGVPRSFPMQAGGLHQPP
ncbi:MAG: hypothetical protein U5J82_06505 [Desulfobacterales bacterium]|nr:hypothetical protein [Desulfobacterales bacterium]